MIESSRPVPVRHPIEAISMEIPKMDWEELVEQVKQDLSLEVVVEDEYTFLHSHF
jgi:imidazoleglycerol phosphate synthase glutamine amidotransferase subunit HisH